jgi:hypothetical protein
MSSPLPIVVRCADLGNDICALLLSSRRAIGIPSLLDNVAESLSWMLETAPFPIASAYSSIEKMHYLACIPGSTMHLLDVHVKIVLAAVVKILTCAWEEALQGALIALHAYLQVCWENRFTSVPFKGVLLDIHEYL